MVVSSLVVAIVSMFIAAGAVYYARQSAKSGDDLANATKQSAIAADKSAVAADRAAVAAEKSAIATEQSAAAADKSALAADRTAALDEQRRHKELTPRFEITAHWRNPGSDKVALTLTLREPDELLYIDQVSVYIQDDSPWRGQNRPTAGGTSPNQIAEQIWGPYRFVPGTGPGVDGGDEILGASRTGRDITVSRRLLVGDPIPLLLEPTRPPAWSNQTQDDWERQYGQKLRLLVECYREDHVAWHKNYEVEMPRRGL
jgi:hypothetical protein